MGSTEFRRVCSSSLDDALSFERLPDDVLAQIFAKLNFQTKKDVLQRVCMRWRNLLAYPSGRGVWGEIVIKVSAKERKLCDLTSKLGLSRDIIVEVLDNPDKWWLYDTAVQRVPPHTLLSWLSSRASGFRKLSVVLDIKQDPGDADGTVYRDTCWTCMNSVIVPLLHCLESCLTSLTFSVENGQPWEHGFGFHANGALLALVSTLGSLQKLRKLSFDCMSCGDVSCALFDYGEFEQLQELKMINCDLYVVNHLTRLSNLQSLNLSWNFLDQSWLNESLASLTGLTRLVLNECRLERVPQQISNLSQLQVMDLKYNRFSRSDWCPVKLSCLGQLQELDLVNCHLSVLPDDIGELKSLRQLHVSQNRLRNLCPTLSQLTNLQVLRASQNNLQVIPTYLCILTKLTTLDLWNQRIVEDVNNKLWNTTTVKANGPLDFLLSLHNLETLRLPMVNEPHTAATKEVICAEGDVHKSRVIIDNFLTRLYELYSVLQKHPPEVAIW